MTTKRAAMDLERGNDDITSAYKTMMVTSAHLKFNIAMVKGALRREHAWKALLLHYVCHAVWALLIGGQIGKMEPLPGGLYAARYVGPVVTLVVDSYMVDLKAGRSTAQRVNKKAIAALDALRDNECTPAQES